MSKKSIKSDLARIDHMKDSAIDYSDIPPLDNSFYKRVRETWPPTNQQLTIRLDADVLKWLRSTVEIIKPASIVFYAAMESQGPRQSRSMSAPKKDHAPEHKLGRQ